MEGSNDAIQIINVLIPFLGKGMEFIFKANGSMSKKTLSTLKFLGEKGIAAVDTIQDKRRMKKGYTLKQLEAKRGEELGFIRIPEEKLDEVKKTLNQYRVPFSILEDLNPSDGQVELAYHVNDSAKVSQMIKNTGIGQLIDFQDYLDNADEEYVENQLEEINSKKENAPVVETDALNSIEEAKSFYQNNQSIGNQNNANKITINKETLVMAETSQDILTKIPGTNGQEFVTFDREKDNVKSIDKDQTFIVSVRKNKKYKIYGSTGAELRTISGADLKKYYDKVFRNINRTRNNVKDRKLSANTNQPKPPTPQKQIK